MQHQQIPDQLENIATQIVDVAYVVHKRLGPGLLERVYEACFCYELEKRGIRYSRQISVPIVYDSLEIEDGLRLDVLVEDSIICELKAAEGMHAVWTAQVLSYLKLLNKRLGFLINFNTPVIKRGIKRLIV